MKKIILLLSFTLLTAHVASAQFFATLDGGRMGTTYGNASGPGYKQVEPDSAYAALGLGGILFGHSQRTHGINLSANMDLKIPFAQSAPTNANDTGDYGNPFEFGFSGLVNYRYRMLSTGVGFDARRISMTDDPSYSGAYNRPPEWLIGIPLVGKVTFGPAGRAYVQGGATFFLDSMASTYVNDPSTGISATISNGIFSLDPNNLSLEYRFGAGYMFGRWGLRANYARRNVYFTETGVSVPAGFYNMQQTMISGGVVLTMF